MRKDGVKFACLCLDCFATSEAQALQEGLPGDFWVERPWQGFDLSTWAREIGTWRIKEVTESEVFVWVTTESGRLDVQDGENEALSNRLHTFWKGLQLSWPCTPRSAWILTGSLKNEAADVSKAKVVRSNRIGSAKAKAAKSNENASRFRRLGWCSTARSAAQYAPEWDPVGRRKTRW